MCRRIQNNLCRHSALKEVEHNSLFLPCIVTFLQTGQSEREEESDFTVEKPDERPQPGDQGQYRQSQSWPILLICAMQMTLNLPDLPPQKVSPQSINVKSRRIQVERHSTTYLTSTSQSCQGHRIKKSLRNSHSQGKLKEPSRQNVMWGPRWNPGREIEQEVKTKEI